MKTFFELLTILAFLFVVGVAGGLEKGMLTIGQATIAWGFAILVGAVSVAIRLGLEERR